MEAASLENERLRTQLKECQDALEAQARLVQAKDCMVTELQASVLVTKSNLSKIVAKYKSLRKTLETLKESHPKGIDALTTLIQSQEHLCSMLQEILYWLTLTGGVRDVKQTNCRRICAWIRAAAQNDDEEEQDEDME